MSAFYRCGPWLVVAAVVTALVMAALIVPLVYWLLPPPAESAAPAPAEVAQPHSTERGVILDPPIREDKSTPASSDIVSDKRPPDPGHLAPLSPNPESVPATTPALLEEA